MLVHGFTGHPGHFTFMADALEEAGYSVIAPRLTGHGTSTEDLARATATDWIADVEAAAREVSDRRRVHLVGLSMGGLLSLICARSTAATSVATINSPVIVREARLYAAPLARRVLQTAPVDTSDAAFDEQAKIYWKPYERVPVSAAAELQGVIRKGLTAARRLRRPALVVQSRADEAVHPSSALLLARSLGPGARLEWLEHSIHNALLGSERERLHALILEHLRRSG